MKYGKKVKIPAQVGCTSLIGTSGGFPLSWGNYFSFANGYRCVNMWAENLEETVKLFLDDGMIEGFLFEEDNREWFVVCDDRLPREWTQKEFCWAGYGAPSDISIIEEMFSIYDDDGNDIIQFTNPKEYWPFI